MKKALIIAAAVAGLGLLPSATFGKETKKKVAPVNVTAPGLAQMPADDDKDTDKDGNKRSAEKVH